MLRVSADEIIEPLMVSSSNHERSVTFVPLACAIAAAIGGAPGAVVAGTATVLVLILFRHRANVRRLLAGTERRVGQRLFKELAG